MSQPIQIIGVGYSSFTRSVQLCCEEMNLGYLLSAEFDGKKCDFGSTNLLEINPFGKVPVLIANGKALYETQSICRYLDNQFNQGKMQGKDAWEKAQIDQWCSVITCYLDRSMIRDYLLEFVFPKGENKSPRWEKINKTIPQIKNQIHLLEKQMGNNEFLLGREITIADLLLAPILHYLVNGPKNEELFDAASPLRNYVKNWQVRPSGKKILLSA